MIASRFNHSMRGWLTLLFLNLGVCDSRSGVVITEDFSHDPIAHGWQAFGSGLFNWNATNENLEVTWDSAEGNSYFWIPLPLTLATNDDFGFSFEFVLNDVAVGVNQQQPYTFQMAIGLVNQASATNTNLQRGSGINPEHGPRNCAEFDYFPDSGFGATISPTLISSNNEFAVGFDFPLELDTHHLFQVTMYYTSSTRMLSTTMTRDGEPFGPIQAVTLGSTFSDFRLDHFAISSYCDAGADGSLLAHGIVDNLVITTPDPPIGTITGGFLAGHWQAQFNSRNSWVYTLERTSDLQTWVQVGSSTPGTGGLMTQEDPDPPQPEAFYRVKAIRP